LQISSAGLLHSVQWSCEWIMFMFSNKATHYLQASFPNWRERRICHHSPHLPPTNAFNRVIQLKIILKKLI